MYTYLKATTFLLLKIYTADVKQKGRYAVFYCLTIVVSAFFGSVPTEERRFVIELLHIYKREIDLHLLSRCC